MGGVSGLENMEYQLERLDRMINLWKKKLTTTEFIIMGDINVCYKRINDSTYCNARLAQKIIDYEIEEDVQGMTPEKIKMFLTTISDRTVIPMNEEKDKEYYCGECDHQTKYKGNLKEHYQSAHAGVKYECQQCDYKATTRSSLQRHPKSVHDGIKYLCQHCDYKATRKTILNTHMKSVHCYLENKCEQCDYKTTQKEDIKVHIKSFHDHIAYETTTEIN